MKIGVFIEFVILNSNLSTELFYHVRIWIYLSLNNQNMVFLIDFKSSLSDNFFKSFLGTALYYSAVVHLQNAHRFLLHFFSSRYSNLELQGPVSDLSCLS
ncbi:hypothetical protein ABEB36_012672 [Hypothenemus hampei]|uniref:Uncharacterized protein n=1 Tax=Hypothenemus hampei TaxID=57062 RepID=A0ABD1EC08_HYPHA